MGLFVIMHDETQQICPVVAANKDEAREMIAQKLGADVSHCPVYDADNEDDVAEIVSIIAKHCSENATG